MKRITVASAPHRRSHQTRKKTWALTLSSIVSGLDVASNRIQAHSPRETKLNNRGKELLVDGRARCVGTGKSLYGSDSPYTDDDYFLTNIGASGI
jgi:hypothetical protein